MWGGLSSFQGAVAAPFLADASDLPQRLINAALPARPVCLEIFDHLGRQPDRRADFGRIRFRSATLYLRLRDLVGPVRRGHIWQVVVGRITQEGRRMFFVRGHLLFSY